MVIPYPIRDFETQHMENPYPIRDYLNSLLGTEFDQSPSPLGGNKKFVSSRPVATEFSQYTTPI
jgi:hypothetical protein